MELGLILVSSHSTINALLLVISTKPYRNVFIRLLKAVKLKFTKKSTNKLFLVQKISISPTSFY